MAHGLMPSESVQSEEGAPGNGEGHVVTVVGALDMADHGDRSKLFHAIRRGWKITPERKEAYFKALDAVVDCAMAMPGDKDNANAIIGANRVLQMEQSSAAKHIEKLEEWGRIDEGKLTGRTENEHTHTHTIDYDATRGRLKRRVIG